MVKRSKHQFDLMTLCKSFIKLAWIVTLTTQAYFRAINMELFEQNVAYISSPICPKRLIFSNEHFYLGLSGHSNQSHNFKNFSLGPGSAVEESAKITARSPLFFRSLDFSFSPFSPTTEPGPRLHEIDFCSVITSFLCIRELYFDELLSSFQNS